MQVILLKDVTNVGAKHTIVEVKNGFGRNYLIPQKLALIANDTNRSNLDKIRETEEASRQGELEVFRAIGTKLEATVIKIAAKAGSTGKIFGSVTNIQIAQAIKEQINEEVDRKLILIDEEIKNLGSYTANINFDKDVQAKVNFEVYQD